MDNRRKRKKEELRDCIYIYLRVFYLMKYFNEGQLKTLQHFSFSCKAKKIYNDNINLFRSFSYMLPSIFKCTLYVLYLFHIEFEFRIFSHSLLRRVRSCFFQKFSYPK